MARVLVHGRGERGQALPLVVLVVVAVGGLVFGLGRLGAQAVARAQARTAADAAALAGVVDGPEAAEEVARANGGRLVTFLRAGFRAGVRVEVGGVTADAWAERGRVLEPVAGVTTGGASGGAGGGGAGAGAARPDG